MKGWPIYGYYKRENREKRDIHRTWSHVIHSLKNTRIISCPPGSNLRIFRENYWCFAGCRTAHIKIQNFIVPEKRRKKKESNQTNFGHARNYHFQLIQANAYLAYPILFCLIKSSKFLQAKCQNILCFFYFWFLTWPFKLIFFQMNIQ